MARRDRGAQSRGLFAAAADLEQVACNQLVDEAVEILAAQLGLSEDRVRWMISAQADGRRVFLVDVAAVIVSAGDIRGRFPDVLDEARFDRRPWSVRRREAAATGSRREKRRQ
jgi:hypothetical protein